MPPPTTALPILADAGDVKRGDPGRRFGAAHRVVRAPRNQSRSAEKIAALQPCRFRDRGASMPAKDKPEPACFLVVGSPCFVLPRKSEVWLMRRSSSLLLAGLAVGSLAVSSMVACGGTETTTGGTSTTTGSGGSGPAPDLATTPDPAAGAAAPDGTGSTVVAIKKLYLGDTNRDGTANKVNGWKQYGYDLDGKASTATSTDLCKPRNNTSRRASTPTATRASTTRSARTSSRSSPPSRRTPRPRSTRASARASSRSC